MDFGYGFGIIILIIALLQLFITTLAAVSIAHFGAKAARPLIARLAGFERQLTGSSRFDYFAYLTGWMILAPVCLELAAVAWSFMDYGRPLAGLSGHFGPVTACLMGLSFWYRDADFSQFRLKPFGRIVAQTLAFILLTGILQIATTATRIGGWPGYFTIRFVLGGMVQTLLVGLLSLEYFRRAARLETDASTRE